MAKITNERIKLLLLVLLLSLHSQFLIAKDTTNERPRARDIGLVVGTMKTGKILIKYNVLNWDKTLQPGNK